MSNLPRSTVRADAEGPMHLSSKVLFGVYLIYPLFRSLVEGSDAIWYLSMFSAGLLCVRYFRPTIRVTPCNTAWAAIACMALGSFVLLGAEATASPKRIITFVVTIALMISLSNSRDWVHSVMRIVLAMLVVHAVATLFFMAVPSAYSSFVKPHFFAENQDAIGYQSALTGHYSYNGMLLSAGVLLSMAKGMSQPRGSGEKRAKLFVSSLLIVVFVGALLATTKKGPLIAVAAAVAITVIIGSGRFKAEAMFKVLFGFALASGAFILLTHFVPQMAGVLERFADAAATDSPVDATSGRVLLWDRAVELWRSSPLVGHGWATYRYYWGGRIDVATITAHNVILNLLAEIGIAGLLIYLVAAVPPFVGLWGLARGLKGHAGQYYEIVFFAFSFQVFYLFYGMSGSPLYDIESYLFYLILSCGVWLGLQQSDGLSRIVATSGRGGYS